MFFAISKSQEKFSVSSSTWLLLPFVDSCVLYCFSLWRIIWIILYLLLLLFFFPFVVEPCKTDGWWSNTNVWCILCYRACFLFGFSQLYGHWCPLFFILFLLWLTRFSWWYFVFVWWYFLLKSSCCTLFSVVPLAGCVSIFLQVYWLIVYLFLRFSCSCELVFMITLVFFFWFSVVFRTFFRFSHEKLYRCFGLIFFFLFSCLLPLVALLFFYLFVVYPV